MIKHKYRGKYIVWEFIKFEDWKEYAVFYRIAEEEAIKIWEEVKKLGITLAYERITILGDETEGFCNNAVLLKYLQEDLQNVLSRRYVLGLYGIQQCPICKTFYIEVDKNEANPCSRCLFEENGEMCDECVISQRKEAMLFRKNGD